MIGPLSPDRLFFGVTQLSVVRAGRGGHDRLQRWVRLLLSRDVRRAASTRMVQARDVTLIEKTLIDYLDVVSPVSGLGSRIGLDATHKMDDETTREWGDKLDLDAETKKRVDEMWSELGIN